MDRSIRLLRQISLNIIRILNTKLRVLKSGLSYIINICFIIPALKNDYIKSIGQSLKRFSGGMVIEKRFSRLSISSKQPSPNASCNKSRLISPTFLAVLHQISMNDPISAKILGLNQIHLIDYENHIEQCACCDECTLANEEKSQRPDRFKTAMMILRQRNPFRMSKSIDCIIR